MTTTYLDATGLRCPLPVLRARKAMKGVAAGGLLEVTATDPSAVADFAGARQPLDPAGAWRIGAGIRPA